MRRSGVRSPTAPPELPQASVFIHDLRPDRRVLYLVVFDQQECLRQYQGERRVALERQADIGTLVLAILHDAQILAIRLHLNVSGTEMDAVRPDATFDDEIALLEPAT